MAQRSLVPLGFGGSADPFFTLRREVDQLFDDMLRGFGAPSTRAAGAGSTSAQAIAPRMDVSENDTELRICADLPGVAPGDVDVSLADDVLTIRGERKEERQDERKNFHVMERSYGAFQRSLRLPFQADPSQVKANFEHGVLTVTVPKSAAQQRSQRIEVQSGSAPQVTHEGGDRGKSSTDVRH